MGDCISREPDVDFDGQVDFDHFHILRAIGKGAFGKWNLDMRNKVKPRRGQPLYICKAYVCIVKKRDTKIMFAMKYMNKVQIIQKHAVENVFREIKILQTLEHPFLVNLWFTFHDREDIFLVLDLMLGGDLSFHLEKDGRFLVPRVKLYLAELALALEYLREKKIIHRDVKPANVLLDSEGHAHLTDFNVACLVRPGVPATSVTGTKPYMAPEVLRPVGEGYSYSVDWWSLGVSIYEMLRGQRPFHVDRNMSNDDIFNQMKHTRPTASARWDQHTCDMLKMLLHPDEDQRIQTVDQLQKLRFFEGLSIDDVRERKITPTFIPPQNRINCDPTHELEEMIVEPNPLHKKHHRLSKRHFKTEDEMIEHQLELIDKRFKVYNRERDKGPTTLSESGTADNGIEATVTDSGDNSTEHLSSGENSTKHLSSGEDSTKHPSSGENSTKHPSSDDAPNTSNPTDKQEQEIESVLTNSAPPYAERTLSGETIISVTSETGELIPVAK